jgi:mRNA-degrading endonuclease RelE of RelBE toxin-antitoxin system
MGFKIAISPRAQKYLKSLDKDEARIIKGHINDEEYADAEYRRFLREKDKYMDFDEFCRQEGI